MNATSLTADDAPAPVRSRGLRIALMLLVPLILLGVGGWMWLNAGRVQTTDNAYVQQNRVSVSAEVGGRIVAVEVRENQHVDAGDVLFRIDDAPYRIALAEAEAQLADARIKVSQLRSDYAARTADVGAKTADVRLAQETLGRQTKLLKDGFTTRAAYDEAVRALAAAQQNAAAASADAVSAHDALGSGTPAHHPLVLAAVAARDKAALDLERTVVRAPQAGIASQTSRLQLGQLAVQGLPLVSIVVAGDAWVEANFKETQLTNMRVGQPATIRFDALPGRTFDAEVTSIGAGTGSEFSVLPAQNATGNWVKVTQRVPVRLRLKDAPPEALVAGLSAEVKVRVRD